MLKFPIQGLMDEKRCYQFLVNLLHPTGLHCRCGVPLAKDQCVHKYNKAGLPSYKCRTCRRVYNVFTDTIFQGTHYSCVIIVLLLQGFAQSKTTQHLSEELNLSYKNVLDWRHKLQEFAFENRDWSKLEDEDIESDEVFINAGEKGELHPSLEDPPRVRANKKKE